MGVHKQGGFCWNGGTPLTSADIRLRALAIGCSDLGCHVPAAGVLLVLLVAACCAAPAAQAYHPVRNVRKPRARCRRKYVIVCTARSDDTFRHSLCVSVVLNLL